MPGDNNYSLFLTVMRKGGSRCRWVIVSDLLAPRALHGVFAGTKVSGSVVASGLPPILAGEDIIVSLGS